MVSQLLYLLSPSSRKSAPHVAHGHDAHPAKPVVIKDDEGTPADVTAEVNAAVAEDAPKADGAEVKAAEPAEPVEEQAPTPAASEESATEESASPSEESSTPPIPEKVEEQSSSDDAKETDAPKKADA
ncbi:hypothetical protein ONZ45_g14260 [Pleurotus djamor]|nr:hypothetical protein ONZ45_g14260 [Pleurotus djamor]